MTPLSEADGGRLAVLRRPGDSGPLLAVALVLVLLAPMLLTDRTFAQDWSNHLWLVWGQSDAVRATGHPTLFVDATTNQGTPYSVYYPFYAFYGGTLYGAAGLLSAAVGGHPLFAYLAFFVLAFAMAAGGWLWLARQAGLRGWHSAVPALVFVGSAYYLSNAYARGTWPETIATSSLPVVIASAVWLLRAERWRVGPVAAFAGSVVLFTGSHNITLVWGTVFLALLAGVVVFALPGSGREIGLRRAGALLGVAVLAALVNAWFLAPDLAYQQRAHIGGQGAFAGNAPFFNTWRSVFDPLRHVPPGSSTPSLYVQMPVLFVLWALVATYLLRRERASTRPWWRLGGGIAVILAAFTALTLRDARGLTYVMHAVWANLPTTLQYLQYAYRLQTYVALASAGLVLVVLVALRRAVTVGAGARRALEAGLAVVCALAIALGVWQVWSTPSFFPEGRSAVLDGSPQRTPDSWSDPGDYRDLSLPVVAVPGGRRLTLAPGPSRAGDRPVVVAAPDGPDPIATNIATGDYLVNVGGAKVLGRDAQGYLVLQRPADKQTGDLSLSVRGASSASLDGGRVLTVVALLGLVLVLLLVARRPPALGPRHAIRPV